MLSCYVIQKPALLARDFFSLTVNAVVNNTKALDFSTCSLNERLLLCCELSEP